MKFRFNDEFLNTVTYLEDQTVPCGLYHSLDPLLNKNIIHQLESCIHFCSIFLFTYCIVDIWYFISTHILTSLYLEAELFLLVSKVTGCCSHKSDSYSTDDSCKWSWTGFCRLTSRTKYTVTADTTFSFEVRLLCSRAIQSFRVTFMLKVFINEFSESLLSIITTFIHLGGLRKG